MEIIRFRTNITHTKRSSKCSYGQKFYVWLRWHFAELAILVYLLNICNHYYDEFGSEYIYFAVFLSLPNWIFCCIKKWIYWKLKCNLCLCLTHHSYEILYKIHSFSFAPLLHEHFGSDGHVYSNKFWTVKHSTQNLLYKIVWSQFQF